MLTLEKLGPEGLRDELDAQRKADAMGVEAETGEYNIAGRLRIGAAMSRKGSAKARLAIEAQRHVPLIRAHILKYYETQEIRNEIIGHVDSLKNLQRQVTNRVAIAYNRPPARTLRGVPQEQEAKFRAAYKAAKTDSLAEKWNRYAFFLSVVHVLPRYESGRLRWVTVLPDSADVLFDPDGEDEPSILLYETRSHGAAYVAVDSERWWWIAKDWTIKHEEPHHMGMRPWVALRWQEPPEDDYWDRGAGQDLLDATLELGRVYAHARWVRKNWAKKLTTLHTGNTVHIPENQNLGANQPVKFEGSGQALLQVHDTIVGMSEFQAEMREIVESICEAYGLPSNLIDFATRSTEDAANAFGPAKVNGHDALVKIRDQQIKHFDAAEVELAVRGGAVLRAHGELALSEEQIREAFRCRFGALTFADHPKARVETLQAKMAVAHANPYDEYMLENPSVTLEEAMEEVDRNVELRARLYRKFVTENVPMDPSNDLKTAAQLNGQIGGQQSGDQRQQQDEDNNDRTEPE